MDYNDFPILDDISYSIIRERFNNSAPTHHELIANIFTSLELLINSEIKNINQFNKSITTSLNNNKQNIKSISDNFSTLFNLTYTENSNIKNLNIFTFVNKEIKICKDISTLINKVEKNYLKQSLSQMCDDILSSSSEILSALETTSMHIFKYF